MRTTIVTLPALWASALINNDSSGLDETDVETLHIWLTDTASAYGPALMCSDESTFSKMHGAYPLVMSCECLEYTFLVLEKITI